MLVAHVDLGAGDAPVAMTAGPALFVEVEVDGVAGVAGVAGPDLDAGAGVAGEDGGGVTLVVGAVDVVGLVEASGGRPWVICSVCGSRGTEPLRSS